MVFPQDKGNEIDTQIMMVTDVILGGIGKGEQVKEHCNLAGIILDDIYGSRGLCKNEFQFIPVCNILL